jgi:hypothetical protein
VRRARGVDGIRFDARAARPGGNDGTDSTLDTDPSDIDGTPDTDDNRRRRRRAGYRTGW